MYCVPVWEKLCFVESLVQIWLLSLVGLKWNFCVPHSCMLHDSDFFLTFRSA